MVSETLKITAFKKPPTSNPLTMVDANITIKAFITKVNKPSVRILIGKVNNTNKGLINKFNTPRTTTKIIALHIPAI